MLSIKTINSGTREEEEYYSEDESLETEADQQEYYTQSHSATGKLTQAVWHGQGADHQGLAGNITKAEFKELFYGYRPDGVERIRGDKPNPEDQERLGHDLTFSAPKSVSMALELGDDLQIFDDHMAAVKECISEVEARYAQARIQTNGQRQVVDTRNLTVALIPHHTSRDGDMQLHTHAFLMNGTQGPDGTWRALWHESLIKAQWIGSLYRNKLAQKLQARGYKLYETKDGFELEGISREQILAFSKRSRSIVKKLEQQGLEINPKNRGRATLTTRQAKHTTQTLEEFQQGWQSEATALGVKVPLPGKPRLNR